MKKFLTIATALVGLGGTGAQAQNMPNPAYQTGWETQARANATLLNNDVLLAQKNTLNPQVIPLNFSTEVDGKLIVRGGAEYSSLRGALLRGGVVSLVGSDGAVAVDMRVGSKEKEVLAQMGMNVGEGKMVKLSFAHLSQMMDFLFPSGSESAMLGQNTLGLTLRIKGNDVAKFFELSGYIIDAQGHDFGNKEYSVDTTTLYQLFRDPRRVAGSRTTGVEGKVQFVLSQKNEIHLDLSAGVQQTQYKTLLATPSETHAVGGVKLSFPLINDTRGYVQHLQKGGGMQSNTLGIQSGWVNVGLSQNEYNGQKDERLMVGLNVPLDANFKPVQKPSTTSSSSRRENVEIPASTQPNTYSDWMKQNPNWTPESQKIRDEDKYGKPTYAEKNTGRIMDFVGERPTYVPFAVKAKIDPTATPVLLISVDKTQLPAGSTIDKVTGKTTIALATAPGALLSATNQNNGASVLSAFSVAAGGLVFDPRAIEGSLTSGLNTVVVDASNQIITLGIMKGSVHLVSVKVESKNTIGTVSALTILSKTSTTLTLNAVTGSSDISDITYVLSNSTGTELQRGTTTTFSGLSVNTLYKVHVEYKDTNETTGAKEVKTTTPLSVTTDAPANTPGTISAPTLESKTSTSINTAPGVVAGMTNIRVALYTDANLTNKVAENTSGDFTGLSASTTYYAVTIGDDLNENTGATETKYSSALTVLTDTPPAIAPTSTLCSNQTATVGDTDFTCTFTTNSTGAKTWSSSNTAVATVDSTGKIHYVGAGTATITVQTAATTNHLAESKNMTVTVSAPDPAPIAGGAFASLADMTISDQGGGSIPGINAGGVTDSLGRTIVYTATGLPSGLSIDSSTGVINGTYDAGLPIEDFSITIIATPQGGVHPLSKSFILSIRNDG